MFRPLALGTSLLCIVLTVTACGEGTLELPSTTSRIAHDSIEAAEDYDAEAHFTWAYTAMPTGWDPVLSDADTDLMFWTPVYDRLLREDADGQIHPMLAEDFTASDDGKTLTLELRQGLVFEDGTPFDADVVKFNLDRARAPGSTLADQFGQVDSVEAIDAHTVVLHLSGRIGPLPATLANIGGIMVSPSAVEAGTLAYEPAGIGPYRATKITPGEAVDYETTPEYWDPDAQRVATMTYLLVADDQQRLDALASGAVDGITIPPTRINPLLASGHRVLAKRSAHYLYLALNTSKSHFGSPWVRLALNLAIDREEISQVGYDGYCTPSIHPMPGIDLLPSGNWDNGLRIWPHDPVKARAKLEYAGFTEPISMSIAAPAGSVSAPLAETLTILLSEAGFEPTLELLDSGPTPPEFITDQTAEALLAHSTGLTDHDQVHHQFLRPDAPFNPGGSEFPILNEWAAKAASSLDPATRESSYEKVLSSWLAYPPHLIPICMTYVASAYADYVSGVGERANGIPDLRGVAVSPA